MATFTVPAFNVQLGVQTLGPFVIPSNWTSADLVIDGAAQTAPLVVTLEYSPDGGANWAPFCRADFSGPTTSPYTGAPITDIDLHVVFPQRVPGAAPRMRATIDSQAAWHSAGGAVTVN